MTHDELLARLDDQIAGAKAIGCECSACDNATALRAVVELHKPIINGFPGYPEYKATVCLTCGILKTYPCSTIQAIEKVLM